MIEQADTVRKGGEMDRDVNGFSPPSTPFSSWSLSIGHTAGPPVAWR